jgi:hypothetical protein
MTRRQRGQSLVEGTLVMIVFFGLLMAVVDCGQVLFAHESLVERTRGAVRWGVLHNWQGPDPIVNLVLYGQTTDPNPSREGYLGLKPENVQVAYQPPVDGNTDNDILTVRIVNYRPHLFSPWIATQLVSARPVLISAPMAVREPVAQNRP